MQIQMASDSAMIAEIAKIVIGTNKSDKEELEIPLDGDDQFRVSAPSPREH